MRSLKKYPSSHLDTVKLNKMFVAMLRSKQLRASLSWYHVTYKAEEIVKDLIAKTPEFTIGSCSHRRHHQTNVYVIKLVASILVGSETVDYAREEFPKKVFETALLLLLLLWAKWRLQFEDFKEERKTWLLLGEKVASMLLKSGCWFVQTLSFTEKHIDGEKKCGERQSISEALSSQMASTRNIIATTRRLKQEVEVINRGNKLYHILLNEERMAMMTSTCVFHMLHLCFCRPLIHVYM